MRGNVIKKAEDQIENTGEKCTEYPSKIGPVTSISYGLLCVLAAAALVGSLIKGDWTLTASAVIFVAVVGVLVMPMWFGTRYTLREGELYIQSGLPTRITIPYSAITGVEHSRSIESAPALSFRRLRVRYTNEEGTETSVLISPKDRDGFSAALQAQLKS